MKSASFARRAAAAFLAAAVLCASALPAFAEGEAAANTASKEEVIYGKLAPDGTVQSIYAVNHFEATAGDTITDYGTYTAVRNMTTTDPLTQGDGTVSLTPSADGSVYYEGTMDPSTPLPWLIQVHYILDGTEVEPEDLAGRSGALILRIDVNPNPDCNGDWFNQYALQTTVTLDTAHADNIRADGGTIASVGSEKQIVFTLLPGQTSEVEVAADVTDFTMPAITFNGVQLQLKLDIDGVSPHQPPQPAHHRHRPAGPGHRCCQRRHCRPAAGPDPAEPAVGAADHRLFRHQQRPQPAAERRVGHFRLQRPAVHPADRFQPDRGRPGPAG